MPTEQLPFAEAIAALADKINIDSDTWLEGSGDIQQVAFTVAGAKGAILQEIRAQVDRAVQSGISMAEFRKQFDRIADSYVDNWQLKGNRAYRSQLIYDTNLRTAYGAGRYRQMTEPSTLKSRPFWLWKHGDTRVPRPTHLAMNGKVFPAGSLQCHVPAGFNCACQIFSLSQRDVDREGLTVEDASDFEADKGFNYLPGKLTKERRNELLKNLDPDIRKLIESETEAEFKLPEGSTKRQGGKNYVLTKSRWHLADNQESVKRSRAERSSLVFELTQQFEHDMAHGTETYESVAEKFIHQLTQLGDRDRAEREVAGMDIQTDNPITAAVTRKHATDFCQLVDKPSGVRKIVFEQERARAIPWEGLVDLEAEGTPVSRLVQYHEMAHCLEYQDHNAGKEASDWVKGRATGGLTRLSEITGDDRFRDDEMALPDSFIDHYVGKLYSSGITEVHSMGLQAFANPSDLVNLYKTDPEHFRLIMRIIRA